MVQKREIEPTFDEKVAQVLNTMGFPFLVRHLDENLINTQWNGKEKLRGEISFFPPMSLHWYQLTPTEAAIELVELHENWEHV
ncbi:MAG: hypothetical protein V7K97_08640 [Nostoc sp.]|uniref:hypothetical protein n=1 Tax=Nostoc sp. TaxID=1180 RepID=UPI002FF5C22C